MVNHDELLYVVIYEYYDVSEECIVSYRILGVADSMENAIKIIEDDFEDVEKLSDYDRVTECDGSVRYTIDEYVNETYYFIKPFKRNKPKNTIHKMFR